GCGSGLCRKLEHCCFLTFEYVSEEHHLPVWKFQRIMMCSRLVLVDLPEDGSRVIDCIRFPAKQPALPTPHLLGKGDLRSRKNTNCCPDIFRRSEPSRAGIMAHLIDKNLAREYRAATGDTMGCADHLRARGAGL